MSTKKMLAILASPRKNGNIAKMLNEAVKTAKEQGYEIHYMWLYEKHINFCKGCMYCRSAGTCCIKDDIQEFEQLFKESDLVVMGAPTYFANIPAVAKNLFDRLAGIVMDDNAGMIPKSLLSSKQNYLMLTTCTTPAPFCYLAGQTNGTLRAMNEFFNISGMHKLGSVVFAGTRNKKEVPNNVLRKIRKKVLEATKRAQ